MAKKMFFIMCAILFVCTIAEGQENDWRVIPYDSIYEQTIRHDSVRIFSHLIYGNNPPKEFYINDYVRKATRAIYVRDSTRFMKLLNLLLSEEKTEEMERIANALDRLSYIKLIKMHSSEIIQKLSSIYKRNDSYSKLLSLTNLPDSIRNELLEKSNCRLCKARLGDSTAIAFYMDEYIMTRDQRDSNYREGGLSSYDLEILFSLNSKTVFDTIFNDIQSTKIITQCDRPDQDPEDCFLLNYTYLYSIIETLQIKHLDEPVLNRTFIYPLTDIIYPEDFPSPLMALPGFFKALENFILREYGYVVKINVPFVIAAEPN